MTLKCFIYLLAAAIMLVMQVPQAFGQTPKNPSKAERQICITFDDLPPTGMGDDLERIKINDEILAALDEFGVTAADFVVGNRVEEERDLLESWLAAGHILGNHTWSMPDLNEVPVELFLEDIDAGGKALENLLTEYKQRKRYFRYPFLHYGERFEVGKEVANHLAGGKYVIAHVSIDSDDFAYNLQFEKMYNAGDSIDFVQMGNEYLDHVVGRIEEAEDLADSLLGRPVKQILLLHANRLNGTFLADLLAEIQTMGYSFISLDKALADPVYSLKIDYIGPKGLTFLERLARSNPDLLPAREKH